ncbi:MAG TPA: Pr6Pr family membrane protein [Cellulomonas sp.]
MGTERPGPQRSDDTYDTGGTAVVSGGAVTATRALHSALVLAVLVGVGLEVHNALTIDPGADITRTERLVRLFSFFTIQSNLVVALASALIAAAPLRVGRARAVVQLDALLCIAVTGVVYHALLSDSAATLAPAGQLSNFLMHTVTPIGAWLVWLLVGPRPRFGGGTVGWAVAYPVAWIAYTFIRGGITGWYPYPFLDVDALGLATVARNTAVVAVGFFALAVLVRLLERHLPAAPRASVRTEPR